MNFKAVLDAYMEQIDCTSKELAEISGLSAATISRYRSGERIPEAGSEQLCRLVNGIVRIARNKGIIDVTIKSVGDTLLPLTKKSTVDMEKLRVNVDQLLDALSISVSDLARSLNYDASYISRIRKGQRQPADPVEFVTGISRYIVRRCQDTSQKKDIAELIGCKPDDLEKVEEYQMRLVEWLTSGTGNVRNQVAGFLEKIDGFQQNEYIRVIHFDELKVPTAPFQLPTSKSYLGIKEMMDSELAFLKATVLSRSKEPVIMYSDMPMGEMAKDPEFPKKWMFGMAMLLKKGLHLHQIHNIDRSFEDMMLGLESWIPMYMTGQISPYYFKNAPNDVFLHFLKVSGIAALSGEAVAGYHSDGKYYLTKVKREVEYYRKRAEEMLKNAYPLMEIYRSERKNELNAFLLADTKTAGKRRSILSSLPLYTISSKLLDCILTRNNINVELKEKIKEYAKTQRQRMKIILENERIEDEIPDFVQENFTKSPPMLELSGIFCEEDIPYNEEEYTAHLKESMAFAEQNPNYTLKCSTTHAFNNLKIIIHEGQWVMVSKGKAPAIHFVIRHPKLRNAIECFIPPITEDE